tara:strand:+ start:124 stop:264 length:141 start_codon:yes stop_codon:yes gene_type:complete
MKNIFERAFLKLDKYLTDELAIMLIMIIMGILLGKLAIALLSIILI